MTYRVDLRKKVVVFVHAGGSQAEAARRFDVSLWCVRDWRARKDLERVHDLLLSLRTLGDAHEEIPQ